MLYAKSPIMVSDDLMPDGLENARIYLASPYTHKQAAVMVERYNAALAALHFFMKHRLTIYSPIVHSHVAAEMGGLPVDFKFWSKHCLSFLETWATELWVLQIPGVDESVGVEAEIMFCHRLERRINGRTIHFPADYFK